MSVSVGIVGLPNVGKSTLFKALTKKPVDISNYPFCTIEPNIGIVEVPDLRLDKLAEISKGKKIVPSIIKFVDVAGIVKGAAKGEGLGNQFLAHLRECDVLLHIVRRFDDENIAHIDGAVNPMGDIETVKSELILKDLETIENRLQKIEKDVRQNKKEAMAEFAVLENLKQRLGGNGSFRADRHEMNQIAEHLFLLAGKPQIYLLNSGNEKIHQSLKGALEKDNFPYLAMNLQEELDKSELTIEERKELGLSEPKLAELIKKCDELLNLITFFTIAGEKEIRAWSIKKGSTVLQGADRVHSDFAEKFITALVINWQKLKEIGSWKKAQELGLLKTAGKEYIIKDGDVIEIKI